LRGNYEQVLWEMKFAQCWTRAGTESHARDLKSFCNHGELLMRSKLPITALVVTSLVVTSLVGSMPIASAQTQTGPGVSSEGNVSPGATSGKKTHHEKGMTTGSSTRSGANNGGTMNPSDQGNAGSGANNMAAPKSGSKY
jgi:hypothetical protein